MFNPYPVKYAHIPGHKPAEVVEEIFNKNKLVAIRVRWTNLPPGKDSNGKQLPWEVKTVKWTPAIKFLYKPPWYRKMYIEGLKWLVKTLKKYHKPETVADAN